MATINQSPANQPSITLSGIDFTGLTATTITPFRQNRKTVGSTSVAINLSGTGPSVQPVITLLGRLIGRSSATSAAGVSGIFNQREQAEARRRNAWPG